MRRHAIYFLSLFIIGSFCTNCVQKDVASPKKLVWSADYSAARVQAKKSGLPLVVYFNATWCGHCRKLEKSTLADAKVIEALQDAVLVQLDIDTLSEEATRYSRENGVRGVPTIIFADSSGVRRGRVGGSATRPQEFLAMFEKSKK